jgi:hypothetical protein
MQLENRNYGVTNAEYIVHRLLEYQGYTVRFGPGEAARFFQSLRQASQGDLDGMIRQGYRFFTEFGPGDIRMYGKPPVSAPLHVIRLVSSGFAIDPDKAIVNVSSGPDRPTHPVPFERLFVEVEQKAKGGGEKPRETAKQKLPDEWTEPAAHGMAVPSGTLAERPWHSPDRPHQEEIERYIGSLSAIDYSGAFPITLGFESESAPEGGVRVVSVDPDGPARAVLRAGDRIVGVKRFPIPTGGALGPWKIENQKGLNLCMKLMHPSFTVPLDVVRGGSLLDPVVLHPRSPGTSTEQTQLAATSPGRHDPVYSAMTKQYRDLPHLTVNELAKQYHRKPEQIVQYLAMGNLRAKDFVPGPEPERPAAPRRPARRQHVGKLPNLLQRAGVTANPPEPPRRTGEAGANVSALT